MRICVIGSCGKKKKTTHANAPNCINLKRKDDLKYWQNELATYCVPTREMYTGNQNRELVRGVDLLRQVEDVVVDLSIISAGFGILKETELVPPYECTFAGLSKSKIQDRSESLEIGSDFEQIALEPYDLYYLALGKDYFTAINGNRVKSVSGTVIQFVERSLGKDHVWLPSGNKTVKAFSVNGHKVHGAAGFKGDLLRILATYAKSKSDPYGEIMDWTLPSYFSQLVSDFGSHSTLEF